MASSSLEILPPLTLGLLAALTILWGGQAFSVMRCNAWAALK
jgi:hypothetical protein